LTDNTLLLKFDTKITIIKKLETNKYFPRHDNLDVNLVSKLICSVLYLRNVEKITEINNEKINSFTIRLYKNTMRCRMLFRCLKSQFPHVDLLHGEIVLFQELLIIVFVSG